MSDRVASYNVFAEAFPIDRTQAGTGEELFTSERPTWPGPALLVAAVMSDGAT